MKTITITTLLVILLASCTQNDSSKYYINGVSNPIITLDGTWKINLNPPEEFWNWNTLNDEWKEIEVPGEAIMQGFPIKHDKPFVYKKSFNIPKDFSGKTIKLQFDGVYSYARVWINGNYIRDHSGGFTRWECDITSFVQVGETAMLTVEVTDKADDISYASGYAKHLIGGILRSVRLLALPLNYPEDITIKTDLDENFENAALIISGNTKIISDNSKITLELFDQNSKKINLKTSSIQLTNSQTFQITNPIKSPLKWDAEHPNLYSLKISFSDNEKLVWQKVYKIGFREVAIDGNEFLVNGREVKLRGACRHDIHPLLGRVSTPEYELKDVLLAKEANMNFIRTSHYPPTESFLKLCDEYGIYVEDETAICFVGTHRSEEYSPSSTENDSNFTKRYLSQLEEMVTNHKNHPSVIMWSVGNENEYGFNFQQSYDWVKANDDTRPVIFSYPGKADSAKVYDILSIHYPNMYGNMEQHGAETKEFGYAEMPVIFDEWAHVAAYNKFTISEDSNIRDFWGISLDSLWQKTFNADGGLGGAIWGMIDETFMLPDSLSELNESMENVNKKILSGEYSGKVVGYGEWGIVDTWRRKKPEFWNTKKAYSPVKLLETEIKNFTEGVPISIPLYNRFDHTNINELKIKLTYKGQQKDINPPDIEPHTKGSLSIPMKEWETSEAIIIEFFNQKMQLVDKYRVRLNSEMVNENYAEPKESVRIEENENELNVICENNTSIIFNKKSGLITEIRKPSDTLSLSGPFINLRTKGERIVHSYYKINEYGKNWQLENFNYKQTGKSAVIILKGEYDNSLPVEFNITVSSNGEIKVQYQIENIPQEYIREVGIKFEFENIIDSLSWKRDAYWSYYPANHLSAQKGKIALYSENLNIYRKEPTKDWNLDSKSFYYDGVENEILNEQLTNIAKSTKENVRKYNLYGNNSEILSVNGNGNISCRIAKAENKILLFANNEIDYIDLSWRNYQRNIILDKNYTNQVVYKINPIYVLEKHLGILQRSPLGHPFGKYIID